MEKKGISIIMPVYNAYPFLLESLESVLNQTFTDFELICVNDASCDMSAEILHKYANMDNRINILTNSTRQGAAESRNRGMEAAEGKYLSFLDADDIFESDMLELAYNTIEKHQADIVIFEYMHMPTENIHEIAQNTHTKEYKEKYCKGSFYLKNYPPYDCLKWTSSPWNKLYRHSFIKEKKLKFQSLSSNNDLYFVDMAFMAESKLIALDEERVLVHVRDHDSTTRISYDRDPMCAYIALEKVQKELIERELFKEVYEHFYYRAFFKLLLAIRKTKSRERAREFYDFLAQEGIKELCKRGGIYYRQSDKYIKSVFKKFKENSFESQWHKNMGEMLKSHLEKNKELFINFIKENIQDGKKICIWGAGQNGRIFIDFFNHNDLALDKVLDMDKNKEGTYVGGCKVKNPDCLLCESNMKYLVFVSSVSAIDSVNMFVQKTVNEITIVDVQEILSMYCE